MLKNEKNLKISRFSILKKKMILFSFGPLRMRVWYAVSCLLGTRAVSRRRAEQTISAKRTSINRPIPNVPFWALQNENMMEYLMFQQMFHGAQHSNQHQQPNSFANYFFWDMFQWTNELWFPPIAKFIINCFNHFSINLSYFITCSWICTIKGEILSALVLLVPGFFLIFNFYYYFLFFLNHFWMMGYWMIIQRFKNKISFLPIFP